MRNCELISENVTSTRFVIFIPFKQCVLFDVCCIVNVIYKYEKGTVYYNCGWQWGVCLPPDKEKRDNPVCHFVTPLDGSMDLDINRPAEVKLCEEKCDIYYIAHKQHCRCNVVFSPLNPNLSFSFKFSLTLSFFVSLSSAGYCHRG